MKPLQKHASNLTVSPGRFERSAPMSEKLGPDDLALLALTKVSLGKRIVKLRQKLGLSQEDFAARSKVGRSGMSEIETGKANPTLKKLRDIAIALNMSISELLRGIPPEDSLPHSKLPEAATTTRRWFPRLKRNQAKKQQ